ncbi:hypothetical protein EVAR_56549_1 [Eumeta japonica]|uniref:Uncharacterized protein n=1 Tax=Eumeta variegata TaxID=151549 RepID=A0A4C1ZR99_EUMVA|nr:hypothetical protein EVAR_56549_1 [Eumeta japonica]
MEPEGRHNRTTYPSRVRNCLGMHFDRDLFPGSDNGPGSHRCPIIARRRRASGKYRKLERIDLMRRRPEEAGGGRRRPEEAGGGR